MNSGLQKEMLIKCSEITTMKITIIDIEDVRVAQTNGM